MLYEVILRGVDNVGSHLINIGGVVVSDKEGFRDCAEGFGKGFKVGGLCEFDFELGSLDDFALQIVLEGLDELFRGLLNGDELSVSFSFRRHVKFEFNFGGARDHVVAVWVLLCTHTVDLIRLVVDLRQLKDVLLS